MFILVVYLNLYYILSFSLVFFLKPKPMMMMMMMMMMR